MARKTDAEMREILQALQGKGWQDGDLMSILFDLSWEQHEVLHTLHRLLQVHQKEVLLSRIRRAREMIDDVWMGAEVAATFMQSNDLGSLLPPRKKANKKKETIDVNRLHRVIVGSQAALEKYMKTGQPTVQQKTKKRPKAAPARR
jgi:hypothetical protein